MGCDSVKGLERYFWGVAQAYGKKPIKSVAAIETTLKQKFKLFCLAAVEALQATEGQLNGKEVELDGKGVSSWQPMIVVRG